MSFAILIDTLTKEIQSLQSEHERLMQQYQTNQATLKKFELKFFPRAIPPISHVGDQTLTDEKKINRFVKAENGLSGL